ncbi:galactitol-specific PTS system EIIC component [Escherichia coli]|uniref:Galactitol-specific PTS system EIIC component n=1 Tax=Escherichia coli TaxID=562 RepID=A0A2X1K1P4_ECOLX|nr:galactitol-specific PTS system EIIC component [Escherichia coli]
MGFVMGLIIGILAGYDVKGVLQLAVKTAAVMLLMPRVIKPIMDGLTPSLSRLVVVYRRSSAVRSS